MASTEHQLQLNALALSLESHGITITHIDIDGRPALFEPKYRNLPTPIDIEGHIPDLIGNSSGTWHLGESKIAIWGDSNIDEQLRVFSTREMTSSKNTVPLHIVIPRSLQHDIKTKIMQLGLGSKFDSGMIKIWYYG